MSETLKLAKDFMAALSAGDAEAAKALMTEDAKVWHNFDEVDQTREENMGMLEWIKSATSKYTYEIRRQEEIAGGYLQQHILHITNKKGETKSLQACCVVSVRDGKVSRIEEYLDPAPTAILASNSA